MLQKSQIGKEKVLETLMEIEPKTQKNYEKVAKRVENDYPSVWVDFSKLQTKKAHKKKKTKKVKKKNDFIENRSQDLGAKNQTARKFEKTNNPMWGYREVIILGIKSLGKIKRAILFRNIKPNRRKKRQKEKKEIGT
jgi:hypothetical protein